MLSKKTYKRLLAAALFEKLIEKIAQRQDDLLQFMIDTNRPDYNARTFISEMEKDVKKRGRKLGEMTRVNLDEKVRRIFPD